jgi:hypothetical protein
VPGAPSYTKRLPTGCQARPPPSERRYHIIIQLVRKERRYRASRYRG